MTNEEKAREICGCGNCHHNFKGNECLKYTGILCCLKPCFKNTLQAMQWKDEQFESAIKEIKANIIEKKDNKEYYETSKESTLNWILRLIDECCTKGE